MKEIKTKDWKGNEYEGKWNGKTYKSSVLDHPELVCVYVSNRQVHISQEEADRLCKENEISKHQRAKDYVATILDRLSFDERYALFELLINDSSICDKYISKKELDRRSVNLMRQILNQDICIRLKKDRTGYDCDFKN